MKDQKYCIYCVENLTVVSWLRHIFPYILKKNKEMLRGANGSSGGVEFIVYYLKASKLGLLLSRMSLSKIPSRVQLLDFDFMDMKQENGDLIWWQALCDDSMVIQSYIKAHPEFRNIINSCKGVNKISDFLMRHILYADFMNFRKHILTDLLFLIRVLSSTYYRNEKCLETTIFIFSQKEWIEIIRKFAVLKNINIVPIVRTDFNLREFILKFDSLTRFIKWIMYYRMIFKYWIRRVLLVNNPKPSSEISLDIQKSHFKPQDNAPQMAVEYYGHLHLNSPELNSDLFFHRWMNIPRENILIYFQHSIFSATDEKCQEIRNAGMAAVVVDPVAAATPHVAVFRKHSEDCSKEIKVHFSQDVGSAHESRLIRKNLQRALKMYSRKYDFWKSFIAQNNIKMHVSWYKHDSKEYALWDALRDTGGIGVIYQRSFEGAPDPWTISSPDVVFGFSRLGAQLGKDTESIIPYYIITGYLSDYRFPIVRKIANDVRSQLLSNGAKKIIAYFDESSVDDPRWNVGHHVTQENYTYLLNKLLEVPWLGLVLKPKMISSLRRRLGENVFELLNRAIKTGRCFMFQEGSVVGAHPPATAALAADIAIHGHFFAATAGVESALTGTKTIFLDREGYSFSPLYKLGVGRVIYKTWDDLWSACVEQWKSPQGVEGFGDWSTVLDEIDPFRDGRAAERMGTYLQWLMEGFKAKLPRETVMADAAARYTKIWGKDKVFSVNCNTVKSQEFSLR